MKPLKILFRNYSTKTVSIYWKDFDGKEHHYYDLLSMHAQPQKVYVGHLFIIRPLKSKKILRKYLVLKEHNNYVVNIYENGQVKPTKQASPKKTEKLPIERILKTYENAIPGSVIKAEVKNVKKKRPHSQRSGRKERKKLSRVQTASKKKRRVKVTRKNPYELLLEETMDEGEKYEDLQFRPEDFFSGSKQSHQWKRLSEIEPDCEIFNDSFDTRSIVQSTPENAWITCAICAAFSSQDVSNFIQGSIEWGIYSVKINFKGKTLVIIIDDYVPVDKDGQPLCCHTEDNKVIWPALLEKAFAKLKKNYSNLQVSGLNYQSFNAATILTSLLGGKERWMNWVGNDTTARETLSLITDANVWKTLLKGKKSVALLVPRKNCKNGLDASHGYVIRKVINAQRVVLDPWTKEKIVDKFLLFLVKNVYGKSVWTGKWSKESKTWKKFPIIKDQHFLADDEDGSLYWIELKDIVANFSLVWFNQ